MTEEKKELEIVIMPEAQAAMDEAIEKEPGLKDAIGDLFAAFHQAHEGVASGKYPNFEEAMFAITGQRPEKVLDEDGNEIGWDGPLSND